MADPISRFGAKPAAGVDIPKRYNIAPRDELVVMSNDRPEELDLLEWGFPSGVGGRPR